MFLKRLSSAYLVEKDYDAPLFYREKGNKKFQEKDYTGAAVLYSKVMCVQASSCAGVCVHKLENGAEFHGHWFVLWFSSTLFGFRGILIEFCC